MNATATGVLIVASDAATILCWAQVVLSDPALRLTAIATDFCGAVALFEATAPDMLLMDLDVEASAQRECIDLLRQASRRPRCDCLVVADGCSDGMAIAAIEAGAGGCLLKPSASPEQISAALHELRAGGAPLDPLVARHVLSRLHGRSVGLLTGATPSLLTQREAEILRLTAKGLMFETIGDLLKISPHTVVAHTRKIYQKLDVHSRGAAVHTASRNGWL